MALLELDGISKRFGGIHALRQASLSVEAGEVRGLVGENGSGKTTLLRVLAGELSPDGGTVAVGGNEAAARLAGIPVDRVRIAVFAINGALVGLAAVMFAGRIQSASPLIAVGIELDVIAAVLLGGTSFLGGSSTMLGTAIGVMFIAVLQNGLNLLGVQALWQGVVTGSVLILAVWVDRIRRPG